MTGPCAKQTVVAIIENEGKYWIGSNYCMNPQKKCPRGKLPSGQGYELCRFRCNQISHAEYDAVMKAGYDAHGGTLYLIGHTYCCDDCKRVMKDVGIKKVVIGRYPKSWRPIPENELWLHGNTKAAKSFRRGLKDCKEGKTIKVKSLTKFLGGLRITPVKEKKK